MLVQICKLLQVFKLQGWVGHFGPMDDKELQALFKASKLSVKSLSVLAKLGAPVFLWRT
jgi:hypothetical protein